METSLEPLLGAMWPKRHKLAILQVGLQMGITYNCLVPEHLQMLEKIFVVAHGKTAVCRHCSASWT